MALVFLIADTHFGSAQNSELILHSQKQFLSKQFFPMVQKYKPSAIFHLGDLFDVPTFVDGKILNSVFDFFIEPLLRTGVPTKFLVGNHDSYYQKSTNKINHVTEMMRLINAVSDTGQLSTIRDQGEIVTVDDCEFHLFDWITKDNLADSEEKIRNLSGKLPKKVCLGHFDIIGFPLTRFLINEHRGLTQEAFANFVRTYSGHYHLRNKIGDIAYIGNTNENDIDDAGSYRGFCVLDTETLVESYIPNKFPVYYTIQYTDGFKLDSIEEDLSNRIVKVVVNGEVDRKKYTKFVEQISNANVGRLRISDHTVTRQESVDKPALSGETLDKQLVNYVRLTNSQNKKKLAIELLGLYRDALGAQSV